MWKDCIVGILCSSSGANRIPLHVCLVMYIYMAIKLSYHHQNYIKTCYAYLSSKQRVRYYKVGQQECNTRNIS